jgi:hypothetical protein
VHQERGAHAASPPTEDRTAFHGGRLLRQMRQVERTCKNENHMKIKTKTMPDVLVRNEGTVFLFCPLTPQAKEWIDENVQSDSQWFGNVLVVEHRYAWGLAEGMKDLDYTHLWIHSDGNQSRACDTTSGEN